MKTSCSRHLAIPLLLCVQGAGAFQITTPQPLNTRRTVPSFQNVPLASTETTATADATMDHEFLQADRSTTFDLPHDRDLTKVEQEFWDMLSAFSHFTDSDIESVPNSRLRALFEGVKASAIEPAVYRAFEVLFADFFPIRVAGRLIYKKLLQVMKDSREQRVQEVERIASQTDLSEKEVDSMRIAFLAASDFKRGQAIVTKQQLKDSGLDTVATKVLGGSFSVDDLLDKMDHNSDGTFNFEQIVVGLHVFCEDYCITNECDSSDILHQLLTPILQDSASHHILDEKHQRYSDRYDEMIVAFSEWQDFLPENAEGDSRQLDVLRGCFVGANTPKVLEALRIVYVDYQPLRVAGNLIFKLMSALVNSRRS